MTPINVDCGLIADPLTRDVVNLAIVPVRVVERVDRPRVVEERVRVASSVENLN
jgi:hypothetical protein